MQTSFRRAWVPLSLCAISAACSGDFVMGPASGTGGPAPVLAAGPTSGQDGSVTTTSDGGLGCGTPLAPVTLLSLNLHCFRLDGTVFATNAERFAAIASLAAARDVAVIAVQESCERPGEKAIALLRAALEKASAATWSSTWAFAHVAWEGTPEQADEGVGLLVRGALSDAAALPLAVQGPLRRVVVSATLPPELGGSRVTSVHFEAFEAKARTMQAREVAAAALVDTDAEFSAIVAGDFNDVEGSATHAAFPAMGYLAADAGLAPKGIDHVMIHRAAKLRPTRVEEVFLGAAAVSDHPGLIVRFESAAGDGVVATRIKAKAAPGAGHFIALRGDTAPLSWGLGYPMRQAAPGEHALVATELPGAFSFKVLVDDAAWQTGPNQPGIAGKDHVVTPAF